MKKAKVSNKDKKLIKEFAELRGLDTPSLRRDILLEVYEQANGTTRDFYKQEVLAYLQAVKDGKLKAGKPITEAKD